MNVKENKLDDRQSYNADEYAIHSELKYEIQCHVEVRKNTHLETPIPTIQVHFAINPPTVE